MEAAGRPGAHVIHRAGRHPDRGRLRPPARRRLRPQRPSGRLARGAALGLGRFRRLHSRPLPRPVAGAARRPGGAADGVLVLLALPHLIGAPPPPETGTLVPPALARDFAVTV